MPLIDSALLLRAPDENRAFFFFGVFVCFLFLGGNVLYHSTDNGSLTQSGFLGTYEDPIQDVTV